MITYLLNSVFIFASLFVIGSLFIIHFKKPNWTFAPWIGVLFIINITFLINLSKIPIAKNVYDIRFFNATIFTVIILMFIAAASLLQLNKLSLRFSKKEILNMSLITVLIVVCMSVLPNQIFDTDTSIINRAQDLKNLSITNELMINNNIQNMNWQAGIPLLIAFYSELLNIPVIDIARIIGRLFFVLIAVNIADLLLIVVNLNKKRVYFIITLSILLFIMILLSQIKPISLTTISMIGLIILISHLTLNYISVLKKGIQTFVAPEELVIATALLTTASILSIFFKIYLAVFVSLILVEFIRNKKISSFGLLKILVIMIAINPMLVGLALKI